MPLPAAIGAGAALAGGIASIFGQSSANKNNLKIAREQMDFQERMSGSAYQRAVADMKLAGINPMLAYMQGGASSPGGQTATMQNVAGGASASAQGAMRLSNEIKMMNKDLKLRDQLIEKETQLAGKAMHERQIASAEAKAISYVPDSGTPEVNMGLLGRMRAMDVLDAELRSMNAALPGQKISGSRAAAIARLIFSGAGTVAGLTGAGALVKRAGRRGPTSVTNVYDKRR